MARGARYVKFFQDKDLALDKHQSYLVRWVRDFLLFARAQSGYSFEQTLDLFLAEVGGRVGTTPWQLQQASDGIRIYRYQYRGAKSEDNDGPTAQACWMYRPNPRSARRGCIFCEMSGIPHNDSSSRPFFFGLRAGMFPLTLRDVAFIVGDVTCCGSVVGGSRRRVGRSRCGGSVAGRGPDTTECTCRRSFPGDRTTCGSAA